MAWDRLSMALPRRWPLRLAAAAVGLALAAGLALGPQQRTWAESKQDLTGRLLVAEPGMPDPRFAHTVVYMVRHNAEGAFGLVINQVVGRGPIRDVLRGFGLDGDGSGEIRVYYGGPVAPRQGFVLHSLDYSRDNTIVVDGKFGLTAEPEVLQDIARGEGPKRSLFALGYAGWGPGQLEGEMMSRAWFTIPADEALIFGEHAERMWSEAVARREKAI